MYNFRCRTRIAGGLMIRDYVANQSKDNNKKSTIYLGPTYVSFPIKIDGAFMIVLIKFFK